MVSRKIFEVAIITTSFCFAGIICHSIILRYLLTVLRLLCALCNNCNIGTSDMPDKYAQGLRAIGQRAEGIHIREITCADVTTNM